MFFDIYKIYNDTNAVLRPLSELPYAYIRWSLAEVHQNIIFFTICFTSFDKYRLQRLLSCNSQRVNSYARWTIVIVAIIDDTSVFDRKVESHDLNLRLSKKRYPIKKIHDWRKVKEVLCFGKTCTPRFQGTKISLNVYQKESNTWNQHLHDTLSTKNFSQSVLSK